ncbi:unnamed protein product [Prunus armeniaca]
MKGLEKFDQATLAERQGLTRKWGSFEKLQTQLLSKLLRPGSRAQVLPILPPSRIPPCGSCQTRP